MSFQLQHALTQSALIGATGAGEIEGKSIASATSPFTQMQLNWERLERQPAFPATILERVILLDLTPASRAGYSVTPRFDHRSTDAAGSWIE